jgi:hypothetical protein
VLSLVAQASQDSDHLRDWFAGASAIAAFTALGIALYNLRQGKKRDRRDLFISIHQALLDPEVVRGRQYLYAIKNRNDAASAALSTDKSGPIYRALAMFDLMGLYAESKWIDEKTVAREWRYSIVNTHPAAKAWIAERYRDRPQWHSWEHYQALAERLARSGSGARRFRWPWQ